jgi:hypothetical protein
VNWPEPVEPSAQGAVGVCAPASSAPYIPILLQGGPRVIKKDGREILVRGKPEEWAVSLGGLILTEPHPTMGDRASADLYIRLLNEEASEAALPTAV